MSEERGNYQILTGLELANLVLRMLDQQQAFYQSSHGSIERKRLVVECKRLEKQVFDVASSLVERAGDTGVFAFEVKVLCNAQREFFSQNNKQGGKYVRKQNDILKIRNLEQGVRESAKRIVAGARRFSLALESGAVNKPALVVDGDDSAPVNVERRGAWEQYGF